MENRWFNRRVISYAHRGGSYEAPSSTLGAFKHAKSVGVSALELDVHSTSDGVLVCCHDSVIDTTTNGRGRVSKMSWHELEALNAGYWFVPGSNTSNVLAHPSEDYVFRSESLQGEMTKLAKVEEVLTEFPDLILNFDIKSTAPLVEPYEDLLAKLILDYDAADRVIVSSFLDSAMWRTRQGNPQIYTSAAPGEISEFYFALLNGIDSAVEIAKHAPYVAFQIPSFFGEIELATPLFIEAAHSAGKAVHVWTVNDVSEMEKLIGMGVDGIISDVPSLLVPTIETLSTNYLYNAN